MFENIPKVKLVLLQSAVTAFRIIICKPQKSSGRRLQGKI